MIPALTRVAICGIQSRRGRSCGAGARPAHGRARPGALHPASRTCKADRATRRAIRRPQATIVASTEEATMRIWTPSDRSASWAIDDIKQSGPDWRALGSSVRSMWNRRAPDVARDPARLKKLADERLSAVAPQIAAPTLA